MVLQFSRSMEEIEGLGFKFDDENHKQNVWFVIPSLLVRKLPLVEYNPSSGLTFDETGKLSRNFKNLKAIVKSHIFKSKIHCSKLEKERKKVGVDFELVSKNRKVGLNLGRAAVKTIC